MAIKVPNNAHNSHDELQFYQRICIMSIKWDSKPAPKKQPYRLWWGAADQCTKLYDAYIHIMTLIILIYIIEIYIWNQAETNNSIIPSNTPSWRHQLVVGICLLARCYFNYLECSYNTWYVCENKWVNGPEPRSSGKKHIIQPSSLGAYSSTCFQWDGEDVPAPWG